MVDRAALPFGCRGQQHFLDDLRQGIGGGFDRAGQRVTAQRAEPDGAHHRLFAGLQREAVVIDHQDQPVAGHGRAFGGHVQRHDLDVFQVDVLPDVQFGPVRDREDPDAFALGLAGVIHPPKLGPLVFRIPAVVGGPEGEHPFLGAGLFFVPAGAAEGRVEAVLAQRLFQTLGLPHVGMQAAMVERVDALRGGVGVLIDDQLHPRIARGLVAQLVHLLEFPGRVDMHQGEGRRRGIERLFRQVQHDRAVLADGIQHDGVFRLGHDFAQDVDTFGFEPLQMGQGFDGHGLSF